jgi:uncharacterized protein YjbI with pentapeptide repeats
MTTDPGHDPRRLGKAPVGPRLPSAMDLVSALAEPIEHLSAFSGLRLDAIDLAGQEAELVEFDRCHLCRVTLAAAAFERPRFTDCLVENCDWANLRMAKPSAVRVRFSTVRLTGTQWIAGGLRDVGFQDCRMDLATFRFATLKDVAFVGCNLTGADFTHADLRRAEFRDCDLTGAQFSNASCAGARFAQCELSGIGGVTSLRGATVAAHDLAALSYAFARALDIVIEEM